VERQYVGIDLHRRRSVIVRTNAAGELLSKVRIDNGAMALAEAVAAAGPEPEVVLEATFGWYWAADVLEEMGARVHLAHPRGTTGVTAGSRTTNGTPTTSSTFCGWDGWPRRGSPRLRSANSGRLSATG
jgi:hypothetical protein